MTDLIRRHPIAAAIGSFFLLLLLMSSVSIVPETSQGVVAQFGKPVRIVNRYKPGDQFGGVGAGLVFRVRSWKASCGSTSECAISTWTGSRCCRPTSGGSRSMPSPATEWSTRCVCTSRLARSTGSSFVEADPRLAASQRAGQAPVRLAAFARTGRRNGEYSLRSQSRCAPIWGRDRRRSDQESRSAERIAAAVGLRADAHGARAGSPLDPRGRPEARADHSRRGRCRCGAHLRGGVRQGSGILRLLSGDAVLPDHLPA